MVKIPEYRLTLQSLKSYNNSIILKITERQNAAV